MKRIIAALLCAAMIFSLAGCKKNTKNENEKPSPSPDTTHFEAQSASPIEDATDAPTDAPSEVPQPTADATEQPDPPKTDEDLKFDALAEKFFISVLISDGMVYHQFVKDPASFGIDESEVERGWGALTQESFEKEKQELVEFKAELVKIDPAKLTSGNVTAYKNLILTVDNSLTLGEYQFYNEPLTPFNGEHTSIPLMLVLYEIANEKDVQNYLLLLESTPEYLAQLEWFEKEKAERGLFMTENALNKVVESCRNFASTGEECFVIKCFDESLNKLDISADKKAEYSKRSHDCVVNEILPAYMRLADTLAGLKNKTSPFVGAKERGEGMLKYYVERIKSDAGIALSPETMAEQLDGTSIYLLTEMMMVMMNDPDAAMSIYGEFGSGDPEADNDYLLNEVIKDCYPEIPVHNVRFTDIPLEIAEDFSPAAYLIAAFDDPKDNVVMFNPTADRSGILFTLAHECYPGHLYQTQYFRSNPKIPKVQQVTAPTGYTEGWAVFSELMVAERAEKYGRNGGLLNEYNSTVANILLPCYISLKVNTEGWTKTEVKEHLEAYGLGIDAYVDLVYEYAVDVPTYFFNYAMGFVNTFNIYKSVSPETNEQFRSFITKYLNYGPCRFEVLFDAFGIDY